MKLPILSRLVPVALLSCLLADVAPAQLLTRDSYGFACGTPNGDAGLPSLSADGRYVAYTSASTVQVLGDNNGQTDVFVRDRWAWTTTCASVNPIGVPAGGGGRPDLSDDARWVAFESSAGNLVPGDSNAASDVFVRDLSNSSTVRVSVATGGAQGNGSSFEPSISDDGRFVVFTSQALNLVPNDGSSQPDVFLHDRDPDANGVYDEANGTTTCLSVGAVTGLPVNAASARPRISGDGAYVAYSSWSDAIVAGDANGVPDVFRWERASATTTILSVASDGSPSNSSSEAVSLSGDGSVASFASLATNLVPGGDGNSTWDVYVRDVAAGTTELVSAPSGPDGAYFSAVSGDGREVVFETRAQLVVGDTDAAYDVYLRDRLLGATTLETVSLGDCTQAAISSSGGVLAWTAALGMLWTDQDSLDDVYVLERGELQPPQTASCFGDGTGGACPCGNFGLPGTGCAHSQGASARIEAYGTLAPQRVVLGAHGIVGGAFTMFLQSNATVAPVAWGDGLRCVGGTILRMASTYAVAGDAYFPSCPGWNSIPARSADLGDPIGPGSTRHYLAYFRDPEPTFCPAPAGSTWNATNVVTITW